FPSRLQLRGRFGVMGLKSGKKALWANDIRVRRRSKRGPASAGHWLRWSSEPPAIVQRELLASVAEEAARRGKLPRTPPARIVVDARHDAVDAPQFGSAVGGDVSQVLGARCAREP